MATKPYDYALNLLAARGYTARALSRKLAQKGFPREESEATIVRLTENGLLNDQKFAEEFARQRLVVAGASKRRVEQLLAQKGIAREVARAATEKVFDEEDVDTVAAIEKIVRKKQMAMNGLDLAIQRRRLFGLLARKGYDIDEINQVLSRMML
jgi:regulatory protein